MGGRRDRTAFVGRTAEFTRLRQAIAETEGCLTITGAPGVGKSRLVWAFARSAPETAGYADLAEVSAAEDVLQVVAASVGVPNDARHDVRSIGAFCATHGPSVLVLDNVDEVVSVLGELLPTWFELMPECVFVITCRQPLRIQSERRFPLEPLTEVDAVALYRSRAADAGVHPDDLVEEEIQSLVKCLDGIPLAIELAASRVTTLRPAHLAQRLKQGFDVLHEGVDESALKGDRGLRGVVHASWELLPETEKWVLLECSVFRGGVSWFAAEAVSALTSSELSSALRRLEERSLLQSQTGALGGARLRTYAYLAAVARVWAEERGVLADIERRHAEYFADLAGQCLREIEQGGRDAVHAFEVLAVERKNLLAVLERGQNLPFDQVGEVALALAKLLRVRGPARMLVELLRDVVDLGDAPNHAELTAQLRYERAETLRGLGRLHEAYDELSEARLLLTECADAVALNGRLDLSIALIEMERSNPTAAMQGFTRAREQSEIAKDRTLQGEVWAGWSEYHALLGPIEKAGEDARQALAIAREVEDRNLEARSLVLLAEALLDEGAAEEAWSLCRRALTYARELGDRSVEAQAFLTEANCLLMQGDSIAAERCLGQAMQVRSGQAHPRFVAHAAQVAAMVFIEKDDLGSARSHLEGALTELAGVAAGGHRIAVCRALLGAIAAEQDDLNAAFRHFGRARSATIDTASSFTAALHILEGLMDVALARRAGANQNAAQPEALAHRRAAEARLSCDPTRGPLIAVAVRWLSDAVASLAPEASLEPYRFDHALRWFETPSGQRVDIARRGAPRRILAALVHHRLRQPGATLSMDDVLRAGWPDEKVLPHAAASRIYAAVYLLRKLGLGDVIETSDVGYRLLPETPIEEVGSESTPPPRPSIPVETNANLPRRLETLTFS